MDFRAEAVVAPEALLSGERARPRTGSTATMWLLLALGDLALATGGFPRMYRLVARWPVRRRRRGVDDATAIEEARVARANAIVWYVKRVQCLQSAFATTCYLRWRGLPADLVVGVQKVPFRGHAWAECAGVSVDEKPEIVARYKPITRCRGVRS